MKTLDHNAINRSLAHMGFRLDEQVFKRKHEDDSHKLCEVQQQFQVPVSGDVGPGSKTAVTINFHETFYYAPGQRENKNEDPQFSWGIQLDSGDANFFVHVTDWILDDEANYIGVNLLIKAGKPGYVFGALKTTFSGTLHCTFQGLAAPVEDPGFDENP